MCFLIRDALEQLDVKREEKRDERTSQRIQISTRKGQKML